MKSEPHHGNLKLISTLGSLVGGVLCIVTNFHLGGTTTLILTDINYILGYSVMVISPYGWTRFLSRSLIGLAIGFTLTSSPIMVSEASPPPTRGFIVGLLGSMIGLGQTISTLTDGYLTIKKVITFILKKNQDSFARFSP